MEAMSSNLQEIVDHINIDLDDYDIEDYDRGFPAYIYDLNLPLSERVRKNLDKARKKAEDERKKAKDKRDAVREEEKRQRANIRSRDANAKRCPSCGNWDHERSTNKNCPHWRPRKPQETGLKRRSTVKITLDGTYSNAILAVTIKETVLKCRNLRHKASVFLNFLTIRRLHSGQPLPHFTQSFFYHYFASLYAKVTVPIMDQGDVTGVPESDAIYTKFCFLFRHANDYRDG